MLKEQAQRTPSGQWVRVVGGWSEFQFAERRMPTLDEINAAAPETPVFILHLYCRALLNKAALGACGYTKDTPNPPGGEIQRDHSGNPTGLLLARPNAHARQVKGVCPLTTGFFGLMRRSTNVFRSSTSHSISSPFSISAASARAAGKFT